MITEADILNYPCNISQDAGYKEHNAGARGIKMITSSRRAG